MDEAVALRAVYERLSARYDIDSWHWRPATPALDVCLGAILVQHTTWGNVEKALANLRAAGAFSIEALLRLPPDELAGLVRPAGLPATKAGRLQSFAGLAVAAGGLEALLSVSSPELRLRLLATPGVGPETADVILLYAAARPAVVHDAYTERLCRRLGLGPAPKSYAAWRDWQDVLLPCDVALRQRFHAAVVLHCKETCRARPRCAACPLLDLCPAGKGRMAAASI